jgi:phosphate transport system substrate-binding protein
VLKFFDWAFKNGGQMATELEYVPMPAPVVKQIQDLWTVSFKDSAGAPIWK